MKTPLILLVATVSLTYSATTEASNPFYVECRTQVLSSLCSSGRISVQFKKSDANQRFVISNGDMGCIAYPMPTQDMKYGGDFTVSQPAEVYNGVGHMQFNFADSNGRMKGSVILSPSEKVAQLRMNTRTPSDAEAVYNLTCSILGEIK